MSIAGSQNASATPLLRAEGITKTFHKLTVLHRIDLCVGAGEKVSIIGPSGSGKTTFLRCLNFIERASGGHIYLDGHLIGERERRGRFYPASDRELAHARSQIGMVFQSFNLFRHLSILDNLCLGPVNVRRKSRAEAEAVAMDLLTRVGLASKAKSYPAALSGGQMQRVAIARALAMEPRLMLFDEATSALDPELVGEVLAVMHDLARGGMTMIVVTHEMQFARDVSDRIVFMAEGKIDEIGPPDAFFDRPESPRARDFLRAVSRSGGGRG